MHQGDKNRLVALFQRIRASLRRRNQDPRLSVLLGEIRAVTSAVGAAPTRPLDPRQTDLDTLAEEIHSLHRAVERTTALLATVERLAGSSRAKPSDDRRSLTERLDSIASSLNAQGQGESGTGAAEATPSATATDLMQLVDRVGAVVTVQDRDDPLITWLYGRLLRTLAGEGVTLIDDTGRLDAVRHEVVGVRPTKDMDQIRTISETVRPGFEYAGIVLRPQQIVLWSSGEAEKGS